MSTNTKPPAQPQRPASAPAATPTLMQPLAPTEFYLLDKLPVEIQLKIFSLSLPSPRLIPLIYTPPTITPRPGPSQDQYPAPLSQPRIRLSHISTQYPLRPPALLHTTHKSRTFIRKLYTPCLPLRGLSSSSSTQLYNPTHDILYLPSLPGYNASFNNFVAIHTLADPTALRDVRRLAVNGDLFLEVEKRRWKQENALKVPLESEGMGDSGTAIGSGFGGGKTRGGGMVTSGKATGKGGIHGMTVRNIADFWDVVRRKFWALEEVWIFVMGPEGTILDQDDEGAGDERGGKIDGALDDGSVGVRGKDGLPRKRSMSFQEKVARAVSILEDETGWWAPRWKVLGCEEGEEEEEEREEKELLFAGCEVVESREIEEDCVEVNGVMK